MYSCIEEFVLKHGHNFSQVIKRPKWINKGIVKECFSNCFHACLMYPDRLTYCEGYATAVIPVHHAWLLYKGQVIDPTWHGAISRKIDNLEYFGVPFNHEYLVRTASQSGYYGVLDNFSERYPLISGLHKPSEFLATLDYLISDVSA